MAGVRQAPERFQVSVESESPQQLTLICSGSFIHRLAVFVGFVSMPIFSAQRSVRISMSACRCLLFAAAGFELLSGLLDYNPEVSLREHAGINVRVPRGCVTRKNLSNMLLRNEWRHRMRLPIPTLKRPQQQKTRPTCPNFR